MLKTISEILVHKKIQQNISLTLYSEVKQVFGQNKKMSFLSNLVQTIP